MRHFASPSLADEYLRRPTATGPGRDISSVTVKIYPPRDRVAIECFYGDPRSGLLDAGFVFASVWKRNGAAAPVIAWWRRGGRTSDLE